MRKDTHTMQLDKPREAEEEEEEGVLIGNTQNRN